MKHRHETGAIQEEAFFFSFFFRVPFDTKSAQNMQSAEFFRVAASDGPSFLEDRDGRTLRIDPVGQGDQL